MPTCKKCNKPANTIQIDDTNDPDGDWELSCGCGPEPHYFLGALEKSKDFVEHVARKNWATPARMANLQHLRLELGWEE